MNIIHRSAGRHSMETRLNLTHHGQQKSKQEIFPGQLREVSGVFKPKNMLLRRSSENRSFQSPDETHPEILEQNSSATRRSVIIEEALSRSGVHSSFKNHSKTFHKLFPEIPEDLEHVFTCALHKEVIYHGKMYVSQQHICFHSSVLLKDTKVMIHISSVLSIKKKHTAKIVPNAVAVITDDGHKYLFGSLRNRESCFQLLQSLCPQTEIISWKSSAEHTPDVDFDRISSQSSLEENPANQTTPSNEATLTDSQSDSSRDTAEQHTTEKVQSSNETQRLNKLLLFYLILAVLLLLSSGYIGLRIVALEEQLSILGSLPEFTQQNE